MTIPIEKIIETISQKEDKIPYKLSEVSEALKDAGERNPYLIENFLESLFDAAKLLEPIMPEEELRKKACMNIASLAYIADCNPTPAEFKAEGAVKAYNNLKRYGNVMRYTRMLIKSWGFDIAPYIESTNPLFFQRVMKYYSQNPE